MKNITNKLIQLSLLSLFTVTNINANESKPHVYVNNNIGFNIDGYQYNQPALPCNIDTTLVDLIVQKGQQTGLNIEEIQSKEKLENGTTPVLLIDIEQLTLTEDHNYGEEANYNEPKIKINAGKLVGGNLQKSTHSCTISQFSPASLATDVVTYNIPRGAVCVAANKCLEELSKDVVQWLKPQVK